MRARQLLLPALLLLPSLVLLGVQIARHAFLCDDAFISFRYARNLKDGHGLVWNPGEYVEGYTNFAWVLELAAIWAGTGVKPEDSSLALSVALTFGTLALTLALARDTSVPRFRVAVLAGVALLYASNRTVAVWATSGLATRQFTFLVLAGVLGVTRYRNSPRALLLGSTALGLAELTRPEALLVGPAVLGWWAVDAGLRGRLSRADALRAALPFGGITAAHLCFRFAYYGQWLPNTWYAKSAGAWWDMGLRYWAVASIEHGLWLLVPLALAGTWARWARARDTALLAAWVWMVPQAVHLARMGGDHFEWRMLDPYFPFLIVGAVEGLAALCDVAGSRVRAAAAGVVGGAALLLYTTAVPEAHDQLALGKRTRGQTFRLWVPIDATTAPVTARIPVLAQLLPAYNRLGAELTTQGSAARHMEHVVFDRIMRSGFIRYEALAESLPDGLIDAQSSIGEVGYRLYTVPIVDTNGLTDAVIARNPLEPGAARKMAHDRSPPDGYLAERGVNVKIHWHAKTVERALRKAPYAVELAPGVVMPFEPRHGADPHALFAGHEVHERALRQPP